LHRLEKIPMNQQNNNITPKIAPFIGSSKQAAIGRGINFGEMKKIILDANDYSISENGLILNKKGKIIKPFETTAGYRSVTLINNGKRRHCSIHRLLAQHFIPNPQNKPVVNHKNGIKTDNRLSNLEWVTQKENSLHAYHVLKTINKNNFRSFKGEKHSNSVLNKEAVEAMRKLHSLSYSKSFISKAFKISTTQIRRIINNEQWSQ
jgi:hypothetical protein